MRISDWSSDVCSSDLHMDAVWCATQDIGQRIAHGTMIFSIGIGLTATTINLHAMSYGYDRLRFIRPVHIGDTITTITTIAEIGRATCRERVCVRLDLGGRGIIKKKKKNTKIKT